MNPDLKKPKLYIYVGEATHFLRWELPEFAKYFELVSAPDNDTLLLVFGPDVLESALQLPALRRYAVLFPGFGYNPLYNDDIRDNQKELIAKYDLVFINPGPLEIAYKGLNNIVFYPFSIDARKIKYSKPKNKIKSIIHISSDYPQKDSKRSEEIMKKTGLKWEVYPSRNQTNNRAKKILIKILKSAYNVTKLSTFKLPPNGYVRHSDVIKKYRKSDAFIHVARDIKDPIYIDGKYTATLIEAGLSGCIVFWHDTLNLGNTLDTVFELPLDTNKAASQIKRIVKSINISEHSLKTHLEMLEKFNPQISVKIRADAILNNIKMR